MQYTNQNNYIATANYLQFYSSFIRRLLNTVIDEASIVSGCKLFHIAVEGKKLPEFMCQFYSEWQGKLI